MRSLGRPSAEHIQRYARAGAVLVLLSLVAGGVGESLVPSRLISFADASATANNLVTSSQLFRIGFAAYLVEALCDVALTLVLYVLLRTVSGELALLGVLFRVLGTTLFAVGELFYFSALGLVDGARYLAPFSAEQLGSLALAWLRVFGNAASISMLFYGTGTLLFGYLMFRSSYLPRWLGALVALSGSLFATSAFGFVLAPSVPSGLLLPIAAVATVPLALWLLVRGVDASQWEAVSPSMP
jgi:hypothetical protein